MTNVDVNVVRAAVVGDVETVKQWLSSRDNNAVELMLVINQAIKHGHEYIF